MALLVSTHLFAGYDFLSHASAILFLDSWNFVVEALRTPNLFTRLILVVKDGYLRVDSDEGVKPAATVFVQENAFVQVTAESGLLFTTSRQDLEWSVNKMRLRFTTVDGQMPSRSCSDLNPYMEHVGS